MTKPIILPLKSSDAALLAHIHSLSFAKGWNADEFSGLLLSQGVGGRLAYMAEQQGAGFILIRTVAQESELLTIAVAPTFRRKGIGKLLLQAGMQQAKMAGAKHMFLEVAENCPEARALYEQAGFSAVGKRKEYYNQSYSQPSDAIVMRIAL